MDIVPEMWETNELTFKLPQIIVWKKVSDNRRRHQGRVAKTRSLCEKSLWRRESESDKEMPEYPNGVPRAWVLLTGFRNGTIKCISASHLNS